MNTTSQLSDYQLHLAGFEGPLDVLLRLIEKHEIPISDVSLVAVTAGFVRCIAEMSNPPPQLLADFVRVAARLLVIKSRSLLPVDAKVETEEDFDDLAVQLREYKQARKLAGRLQEMESRHWRAYTRSPLSAERPASIRFSVPPVARLQKLLLNVRERGSINAGIVVLSKVVSTAELSRRILNSALRANGAIGFRSQVDRNSRSEVVAGFIALLSLLHSQRLRASQSATFGEIYIRRSDSDFATSTAEENGSNDRG